MAHAVQADIDAEAAARRAEEEVATTLAITLDEANAQLTASNEIAATLTVCSQRLAVQPGPIASP